MKDIHTIRDDLKAIRYYYSRKQMFDDSARDLTANNVLEKARQYNCVMATAAPKLYDLYVCLYVRNYTQEATAVEWSCTPKYIQLVHSELIQYLQNQII